MDKQTDIKAEHKIAAEESIETEESLKQKRISKQKSFGIGNHYRSVFHTLTPSREMSVCMGDEAFYFKILKVYLKDEMVDTLQQDYEAGTGRSIRFMCMD